MSAGLCLATVTTDSFVAGTMVLLHSFAAHNPWFRGDVVVIADRLSEESRRWLSHAAVPIRFLDVSAELVARVDDVVASYPSVAPLRARFHALETFRLRGYERVLFCDSDLLFRGSVEELFHWPEPLVACGDIEHYAARIGAGPAGDPVHARHHTFNSGLMLIGETLLSQAHYDGLLRTTQPGTFVHRRVALADQAVLNVWFEGQARIAPGAFNFLLACHDVIRACDDTALSGARVVHFNFGRKPWAPGEALRGSMRDPVVAAACAKWLESFGSCLKASAVRARLPHRS